MRNLTLEETARRDVLWTLGRILRSIHEVPQPPFLESGLFPAIDLATAFSGAVEAITNSQAAWNISLSPKDVVAKVIEALPPSSKRVALHSNPGPVHVFVDPDSHRFSGLIDFGDAYISHPALDLRVWSDPEDRVALLQGYTEEGDVDNDFMTTWQAGIILATMTSIARRPEASAQAQENLQRLLAEM